jgi:hypothetical protein
MGKNAPIFNIGETLNVSAIIRKHDRVRPIDIIAKHLRANGLPSNIPNLQRNLYIAFQLKSLQEKVQPYCLLVFPLERVVGEAVTNRRLADGTIAKENDLNKQMMSINSKDIVTTHN